MMPKNTNTLARRLAACAIFAGIAAAPALAGTTDISNVPLASGSPLPPNVLFTLDNSGSMDWDFLPDYVDPQSVIDTTGGGTSTSPNNPCLTDSTNSTFANCYMGDPPHAAGGQNGSNGVGYDPKLRYLPGVTSTGALKLNNASVPPGSFSPFTSVPHDAYGATTGNANLVTGNGTVGAITGGTAKAGSFDKQYCTNPSSGTAVCRRNGASSTGVITPATTTLDPEGNALAAGQFAYRPNVSSGSIRAFGMPEMYTTASFTRSGSTVTATTAGRPGVKSGDLVWVSTGTSGLNVTCVAVTGATATTFTYTAGSSGTIGATNGNYRKCVSGNWTRSGSTVTVTIASANDALQTNDLLIIDSSDNNQDKTAATGTAVTVTSFLTGSTFGTTFTYTGANSGAGSGTVNWVRVGLYNVSTALSGTISPTAYTITPVEYCSDINLTTCQEVLPGVTPPQGFFAAYVRFCKTQADALALGAVTGNSGAGAGTPRCIAKYINNGPNGLPNYQWPRYGYFNRETIVSTAAPFGNRPARTDCAAVPSCTYTEEMQNFANWYTYYRTRMQMMKTAAGRAFQTFVSNPSGTPPRPDTLRVGYITINSPTSTSPLNYVKINNFNAAQAVNWYNGLYAANPGGGTALRTALSRAGWIFSGKMNTGLTSGIPAADDPIQASCQRNYSILTTDGFWNGAGGQDLGGGAIGNLDNVESAAGVDQLVSRSDGTFDGNLSPGTTAGSSPGGSGTLADVAQYYYQTDLRSATQHPTSPSSTPTANADVTTNNVPAKSGNKDFLTTQHMVTYTLGMADGLMRYQTDYDSAQSGDFFNITQGAVGSCFWAPGAKCDWPVPQQDNATALDDLWHAAVNGRGTYYQALNAAALAQSLQSALGNLNAQTAAAAASATSSPNITQTDNQIFSTTYQTNTWSGKIFAQTIDPVTGNVNPAITWQADQRMSLITGPATDSRRIFTPNPIAGGMMDFTFANILANRTPANEQNFFQNKCSAPAPNAALTQCTPLNSAAVDSGTSMVNFLRGRSGDESGPGCTTCLYRDRQELDPITGAVTQTVIGDTITAKPFFVRGAMFDYADNNYQVFKLGPGTPNVASRAPRLYVGANDGYLHAFDATTGDEVWAYAPRFLLRGMYQLADTAYSANHRFFVDGSPEAADVFDSGAGTWKTIMVGGAGAGGRGWYALDVTDPNTPRALWEFCADSAVCFNNDADIGLSYGNPVIGKRPQDGKWVVVLTSGLNNVPGGTLGGTGGGFFYILDAITGTVLNKLPTQVSGVNVGNATTPSGLMKISGYYDNPLKDGTFRFIYGGDQLGNIWRVDMPSTATTPNVFHIASLKDAALRAQPITTRMSLTHIGANRIIYVGTGRYLGSSDLSDPGAPSGIAWQQSIYAIKDKVVDTLTDYGNIRATGNMVVQTLTTTSTTTRSTSTLPVDWNARDGWYIDLNPGNTTPGERVNVDPELIIGTLVILSNIPTTSAACTVGGESFLYQFDFKTGQYIANAVNGTAGTLLGGISVGQAVIQLPSGAIKDIITTADTSKTSQGVNVGAATAYLRRFSFRER